jgi:predicted secreted protein
MKFEMYNLNDTLIQIVVNEQFDFELETKTGGGYLLYLETLDSIKIQIIKKETISKFSEPRTGGGTYENWTFSGLRKGEYELLFYYNRPWLDEISKTIIIKILVN